MSAHQSWSFEHDVPSPTAPAFLCGNIRHHLQKHVFGILVDQEAIIGMGPRPGMGKATLRPGPAAGPEGSPETTRGVPALAAHEARKFQARKGRYKRALREPGL